MKKNLRKCQIAISEGDKTTLTDKQVDVVVNNVLPLICVEKEFLDRKQYTSLLSPLADDLNAVKNTLVDTIYLAETGKERFTFITRTTSVLSKSIVNVYYDAKYKDILIIPELNLLGNATDDDIVINSKFVLHGHVLGGGTYRDINETFETGTMDINNSVTHYEIPTTKANIASNNILLNANGLNPQASKVGTYLETMITPSINFGNNNNIPVSLIDLGKWSDLFMELPTIPLYVLYGSSVNAYSIKYVGRKKPTNDYRLCFNLVF